MKIKIFNRGICVCALLDTNSLCVGKQRGNGDKNEFYEKSRLVLLQAAMQDDHFVFGTDADCRIDAYRDCYP